MNDLWSDIRGAVLNKLTYAYPDSDFEERINVAEEAARNVVEDAERFLGEKK